MAVGVATEEAAPAARTRGPADCERTRPILEGSAGEFIPKPPPLLLLPRSLPLLLRTIDHRGAEGGGTTRGDNAEEGGERGEDSTDGGREGLLISLIEPDVAACAPGDACWDAFTGVLGACALVACAGTGDGERVARRYGGKPASGEGDRRPLARVPRKRTG